MVFTIVSSKSLDSSTSCLPCRCSVLGHLVQNPGALSKPKRHRRKVAQKRPNPWVFYGFWWLLMVFELIFCSLSHLSYLEACHSSSISGFCTNVGRRLPMTELWAMKKYEKKMCSFRYFRCNLNPLCFDFYFLLPTRQSLTQSGDPREQSDIVQRFRSVPCQRLALCWHWWPWKNGCGIMSKQKKKRKFYLSLTLLGVNEMVKRTRDQRFQRWHRLVVPCTRKNSVAPDRESAAHIWSCLMPFNFRTFQIILTLCILCGVLVKSIGKLFAGGPSQFRWFCRGSACQFP